MFKNSQKWRENLLEKTFWLEKHMLLFIKVHIYLGFEVNRALNNNRYTLFDEKVKETEAKG